MLPLDLTGTHPDNRLGLPVSIKGLTTTLVGEVITSPYGLFYDNVTLIDNSSGLPLTQGEDYVVGPYNKAFYTETNLFGYDSVVLLNSTLSGQLKFYANYVGGDYQTISSVILPDIIDKAIVTRRNVTWDDFINLPTEDNPIEHAHDLAAFDSGYQNVAQALWRLLNNKRTVGTEFIESVATDALSKFQRVFDDTLTTNAKTIHGALHELWDNITVLTDEGGDDINVTSILSDGTIDPDVNEDSQYFILGGVNGEDLTITATWDDGDTEKTVPFGSMVVYNNETFKIINQGFTDKLQWFHNGLYGNSTIVAFTEAMSAINDAANLLLGVSGRVITDDVLSGFAWDEDHNGLYYLANDTNPVKETFDVTARWNGDVVETTVSVPVGAVLKYSAANGVSIFTNAIPLHLLGRPNGTALLDDWYYLPDLVSTFESKTVGDYQVGDVIPMVKGTAITDPTLYPLQGQFLTTTEASELHTLLNGDYGQRNINGAEFALPHSPLGGVCKRTYITDSAVTERPQYLSTNGYSGYTDITGDTLTFRRMELSSRNLEPLITEDISVFGGSVELIGVGVSGTVLYLTGTVSGTRSIWSLTNTNGVSSGFVEVVEIQANDKVIFDVYRDTFYIITSGELLKVEGNQKVFIDNLVFSDSIVGYTFDTWGKVVYLLTADKVYRLDLTSTELTSITGSFTHLTYHWLTNNVIAVNDGVSGVLLNPTDLTQLNLTDSIPVIFDTHEYRLLNLSDNDTTYLTPISEEPFYEYYIKG